MVTFPARSVIEQRTESVLSFPFVEFSDRIGRFAGQTLPRASVTPTLPVEARQCTAGLCADAAEIFLGKIGRLADCLIGPDPVRA